MYGHVYVYIYIYTTLLSYELVGASLPLNRLLYVGRQEHNTKRKQYQTSKQTNKQKNRLGIILFTLCQVTFGMDDCIMVLFWNVSVDPDKLY